MLEGKTIDLSHQKKTLALLYIESWWFDRDPYFMVYFDPL